MRNTVTKRKTLREVTEALTCKRCGAPATWFEANPSNRLEVHDSYCNDHVPALPEKPEFYFWPIGRPS